MVRLLLLLLILSANAASAQRKQLERAAHYERAGMLQEAFDAYAAIRTRKPKQVDAHVGMQRTAQGLLDRKVAAATEAYRFNELAKGEKERLEAQQFMQRMDRLGLALRWDQLVDQARREAQHVEAALLFDLAEAAFREDRFEEAGALAQQSLTLRPDAKETAYLIQLARLEPLYRSGKRAMELGMWRDAFRALKQVTDRDIGYKDAWVLQQRARDEALVVLAYVPLLERGPGAISLGLGEQGRIEHQLAANTKQAMLDLKEPLLMLVDRDNIDQLLAEQQRQMSGIFDDRQVVEAGKLIGARYVLTARILRYDEVLKREIEVQMQLIDAENGRIHLSEVVRVNKQEIGRGNTRSQLLERAAKRIAQRVAAFDPHKR